ncbi:Geranylgeranyl transferase type-2 subunit alpha [Apodemus speciosus]|uniref:Geranylgeranyl transferase type-2 subunit alpha n=1 Tax=Apodemus speciosus TaxID=105296 RepID=A0ABQ0FI56_APOSI
MRFLYGALAVLHFALIARLASNSENCLPLPPEYWDQASSPDLQGAQRLVSAPYKARSRSSHTGTRWRPELHRLAPPASADLREPRPRLWLTGLPLDPSPVPNAEPKPWHGRLKVKTSEEQAEAKRLEREQKLKLYQSATQAVFQKRQAGELDESVLELTSQILGANPDFATLWNCRREVLQQLETQKSPEELAALVKAELGFLESCLRVNPKSYGTWHHRCWLLSRLPEPNWARELELCARFLEADERNFHCWDYRRFVAAQAAVAPAEELAFTDSLITRNFSNYSSWHYRSCLLPQLHPQPDSGPQGRLPENVLLKELELVQNAFFTDPNDQSAWFYHRWLLGREVGSRMGTLLLTVDEAPLSVEWRTPDGRNRPSHVWGSDAQKECVLLKGLQECWCRDSATDEQLFRCELSVEKSTVLQSELESCKELQELEPENKWCLLTIILLMRALDPLLYEKETLQYFSTLKTVDPMRAAYLDDLRSKFLLENSVLKMEYADVRVLHLAHKRTSPCSAIWNNCSWSLILTCPTIASEPCPQPWLLCACLEVLQASDNVLENLDGVANLPRLQELLLCNNRGNSLCQEEGVRERLAEMLPSVSSILT